MTMPNERTRAVIQVRDFLVRLSSPYTDRGLKKIPGSVRAEARALLRHYPHLVDMLEPVNAFDPDLAQSLLNAD